MPEFRLPDLGEGVTEGEVIEWRVAEGGAVARDQILVVVGTDKATVEIPSPFEGEVEAIMAKEGARVEVGQALIRVRAAGESVTSPGHGDDLTQVEPEPPQHTAAGTSATASPPAPNDSPRVAALPSVRRAARERGIALADVHGGGPGGRVRMGDLVGGLRRTPLRGPRRAMAQHMAEAHRHVPQVTVVLECDLEPVESRVRGHPATSGQAPTILGLLSLAVLAELGEQPLFNATLDEEGLEIVFQDEVHLGIAVQTEEGLKVAALRSAQAMSPEELQAGLSGLVRAAREGSLTSADLAGATFTISSGGRLGGLMATPLVNWPNLATLGIHEIEDRPVVREGKVVVGRVANLSLSFDHRVIDGMTASGFLYSLRRRIADPASLFP